MLKVALVLEFKPIYHLHLSLCVHPGLFSILLCFNVCFLCLKCSSSSPIHSAHLPRGPYSCHSRWNCLSSSFPDLQLQSIIPFFWVSIVCFYVIITSLSSFQFFCLLELFVDFHLIKVSKPQRMGVFIPHHMSHCTWHTTWNLKLGTWYKPNKYIYLYSASVN